MIISIVSLVFAVVAIAVNASGIVRRPRIVARWGTFTDEPFQEGISIIVTARRRPVQIDEIGFVKLTQRPRYRVHLRKRVLRVPITRRQFPEWHRDDLPVRVAVGVQAPLELPARLQDGESVRAGMDLDAAIDALHPRTKFMYAYVKASGRVYLARESVEDSAPA